MSSPLSIVWRTPFGESSIGTHAPRLLGDTALVRAGLSVRGLAADSGQERWRIALDARGVDGAFADLVGDLLVTEHARGTDQGSSFLAIAADGAVRWRADLPAGARVAAAVMRHDVLWVLSRIDGAWRVHRIGAGGELVADPQPEGGGNLAVDDAGRTIGVNIPAAGASALYRRQHDGTIVPCPDPAPGIWHLAQDGSTLVTAERSRAATTYSLHGRDAATLVSRWQMPSTGAVASRDGLTAFATGAPSGPEPVLVDTATGSLRWRGAPLPSEVGDVVVAPPVIAFTHDLGTTFYDVAGRITGETEERLRDLQVVGDAMYASTTRAALRCRLPGR
jgi:hypothetical protein